MDIKIDIPRQYDFTKTNIYVLKLQENKYYIGKTYKQIKERFNEHCKGQGSAWTRKFQPIEVIEQYIDVNEFEEDKMLDLLKEIRDTHARGIYWIFKQLNGKPQEALGIIDCEHNRIYYHYSGEVEDIEHTMQKLGHKMT